jgi:glyoxylase I family protein
VERPPHRFAVHPGMNWIGVKSQEKRLPVDTRTLHHICIQTNEYEKSVSFYTKILGFEIVKETSNFHGRHYNTWLKLDSFLIEMQTPKMGELLSKFNLNTEGIVHFCIYCNDIQSAYQKIKQAF